MKNEKIIPIFEGKDAQDYRAIQNMTNQLKDMGGMLHFAIHKNEDGWTASCNEVEGIVTGGLNSNPSNFEIESQIREAIYTAFDIKTRIAPEKLKSSISELALCLN